jgi:hypothetical protein
MRKICRMIEWRLEIARRIPRQRFYLILVGFHLSVAVLIGSGWLLPEVARARACFAQRDLAKNGFELERDRSDELRGVLSRIDSRRRELSVFGSLKLDGTRAHSFARERAEEAGLTLKGFVAMDTEGEYLVTLEGAFANAVMFARRLRDGDVAIQVHRFTARASGPSGERIELELLMKKFSHRPEFPLSCTDQSQ